MVIDLRTYYIFEIKEEFVKLYEERQSSLYTILKQIYYMNKRDINYGIEVFESIANLIPKAELNKNIFIRYHKDLVYTKTDTEHIINNLYQDEISILNVKKAYIKLSTSHNYSSFFNILIDYSPNYFAVDFKNQDYFFLKNIKVLV